MPAEIRIYFEGDKLLKPGFETFFRELKKRARDKRCGFRLISSKSGEEAQHDFEASLQTNLSSWSIVLRDSEGPLPRRPTGPHAGRMFWMVEMMESWFHADPKALAKFYGARFQENALKSNPNVETIPKKDVERGLKAATVRTAKGSYHKTSHGRKILEVIDPNLVRQAAPNCDRLFQAILTHLN